MWHEWDCGPSFSSDLTLLSAGDSSGNWSEKCSYKFTGNELTGAEDDGNEFSVDDVEVFAV